MTEAAGHPTSRTRRALAWGVHLFTASGAVAGALALLCIAASEFSHAMLLMIAALAIDAVDGTLARAVGVSQVLEVGGLLSRRPTLGLFAARARLSHGPLHDHRSGADQCPWPVAAHNDMTIHARPNVPAR